MQDMWELHQMERRYSMPPPASLQPHKQVEPSKFTNSEDLHAWAIYRQNLNSDFTDTALGNNEKSPLPFGNFQLRETTVQSILNNPKYGPKSEMGQNMFSYLKFGLPRVFPPGKSNRDGSSGYDSSDDGSPIVNKNKMRAKSDPDFRANIIDRQVATMGPGDSWWPRGRPNKSVSEANLLSGDVYYEKRSRSVADNHSDISPPAQLNDLGRRTKSASKFGGSQYSLASRHSQKGIHSILYPREVVSLNEKYFPRDTIHSNLEMESGEPGMIRYPHLQVRNLSYECPKGNIKSKVLDSITFEVRGGELMAVMSTTESEGTALLNILANCHRTWRCHLSGDIMLNGYHMETKKLGLRVAYVQQDQNFNPDMSVRQTMLFHAFLQESGASSRNTNIKGRINALIDDLGLTQVTHTKVQDLTMSERQRLNVACHLLLDADIVLLDQPTKGMDIFDTFFLIEYLRQWATRGRIVIITNHPSTYEIFTMFSKVLLMSTGRIMYYGRRREMLPYFAFIEYPCPAYKNPSDYYLDLVTFDDLSAEAKLGSTQRIEQLSDTYRRRQEPLSDPGPPAILPPKIRKANFMIQILALWIRALIYMFPYNIIDLIKEVCLATFISVSIGAIYWGVRQKVQEQEDVTDRFGYHYVMMAVAPWPLLMMSITDVWKAKNYVKRDINDGLYSPVWYILSKVSFSFPAAGLVYLAYLIPAYTMAGIPNTSVAPTGDPLSDDGFTNLYKYIGYMLLYLFTMRAVAMCSALLSPSRHVAGFLTAVFFLAATLTSGWPVHFKDLTPWSSWFQWLSPTRHMMERITEMEFTPITSFSCARNPVFSLDNTILVKVACGIDNGQQALQFMAFQPDGDSRTPFLATLGIYAFFQVLMFVVFIIIRQRQKRTKIKPKMS